MLRKFSDKIDRVIMVVMMLVASSACFLICLPEIALNWMEFTPKQIVCGSAVLFLWILAFFILGYSMENKGGQRRYIKITGVLFLALSVNIYLKIIILNVGNKLFVGWVDFIICFLSGCVPIIFPVVYLENVLFYDMGGLTDNVKQEFGSIIVLMRIFPYFMMFVSGVFGVKFRDVFLK